ncbi:MAG: PilZ domain-containing protein [Deltaproteobacteria bacterium]|nr:PilZ domain-containing protein [Deltaproteobacteria bacterium]
MSDELGPPGKRRPARPQPLPIEIQLVGSEEKIPAWLTELTLAGGLVEPAKGNPLEVGNRLRVVIRVIGVEEPVVIRCIIRWDRRGVAGVQFFKLSERDVRILMEIIADAEASARNARPTRRIA